MTNLAPERIRELRGLLRLSVKRLAALTDSAPRQVRAWESGDSTVSQTRFQPLLDSYRKKKVIKDGIRVCGAWGCDRRHYARGCCRQHYRWLQIHGFFGGEPCAREGCGRVAITNGLCDSHAHCEWVKTPKGKAVLLENSRKYLSDPVKHEKHKARMRAYQARLRREQKGAR